MSAPHGDAAVAPRAFIKLPDPPSSPWAFTDASSRSFLRKWDLEKHACVARFRYTQPFHRVDADEFMRDFFDSDVVNEHFHVLDRANRWRSVREIVRDAGEDGGEERDASTDDAGPDDVKTKTIGLRVVSASYAKTPCSAVSMSLFDRLRACLVDARVIFGSGVSSRQKARTARPNVAPATRRSVTACQKSETITSNS